LPAIDVGLVLKSNGRAICILFVVSARPGKEALIAVHADVGVGIGLCVGFDVAFTDALEITTT
jgi:hypothetical protein